MDERNSLTASTNARFRVDQHRALRFEVRQSSLDIGNLEGEVMDSLSISLKESAHRSIRRQWLQQLHVRASNGDHCFLNPLRLHYLSVEHLNAILIAEAVESRIEIGDGDRGVMNIEQKHHKSVSGDGLP